MAARMQKGLQRISAGHGTTGLQKAQQRSRGLHFLPLEFTMRTWNGSKDAEGTSTRHGRVPCRKSSREVLD